MTLPGFRYHPDPLSTGSVMRSDAHCVCCGAARGHVYAGRACAVEDDEPGIRPWRD
ncbi:CbrC family protein [Burkholderia pseudomultivorans]|nr:CbrC family protein [Burkholderia pseudomultivorans]MDS0862857.1 CbrC family protein [Burkholderia pseudomultivorans]